MPTLEQTLSKEQKQNLEQARSLLGLRSRAQLIRWFADNAVDIARGQLTGPGIIGTGFEAMQATGGKEEKVR